MISFIIQLPKDNACYLNWLLRHVCGREERAEHDRWLWRNLGKIIAEEIRNAQGTNWSEVFQWKWILQKKLTYPLLPLPWLIVYNFLLVIYRSTSKQHYMVIKKKMWLCTAGLPWLKINSCTNSGGTRLPFVLWGYNYPSILNSKSYLQDVRVLHYLYDMGCLTRSHGSLQMPQG